VTGRRSNQLNYAPFINTNGIPFSFGKTEVVDTRGLKPTASSKILHYTQMFCKV
jgi:hypothetical protein